MKTKTLLGIIVCAVGITAACTNNNQSAIDSSETKTRKIFEYNDKIQNTFFGVPFGSSKDEVVTGFAKHGFYEDYYSTNDRLSFKKKDGGRHGITMNAFSFGGMNWKQLNVYLSNNQFNSIEFTKGHKTKESALECFDYVLSEVSAKYHLFESPVDDTTSYKRYVGLTKDDQWIIVHCYSYESVSHERYIGVTLAYGDNNFDNVSDEL